jgi:hypothetical protein
MNELAIRKFATFVQEISVMCPVQKKSIIGSLKFELVIRKFAIFEVIFCKQ